MLYDNAIQQALAQKQNVTVTVVKLATVTALDSSGRAKVTFFGENGESNKTYNYIEGYIPEVGDKVAMLPQGDTFIILGRIADGDPSEESPYEKKGQGGSDRLVSGSNELKLDGANLLPNASGVISVGSSSAKMKDGYFTNLYIGTTQVRANAAAQLSTGSGSATLTMNNSSVITPSTSSVELGTSSAPMGKIYAKEVTLTALNSYTPAIKLSASGITATGLTNPGTSGSDIEFNSLVLRPKTTQKVSLGDSSHQFNNIYGKAIYQSGSAVTTSDRNAKNTISTLPEKFKAFFRKLRPVSFKYNDGESGRFHAGFIAQEIEEAMHDSDISNMDYAGLVIQENGEYGLRYEELIAIQTAVIQDLMDRVEALERRAKDE